MLSSQNRLTPVFQDIECIVNVQHDCHRGHCTPTAKQYLNQERETTSRFRSIIKHNDDDHFIINTQSLHNYKTIAKALPTSLQTTSFHIVDEASLRRSAAEQIRSKHAQDRKAKADMLVNKITNHVSSNPTQIPDTESLDSQLVVSLENDTELLSVLQNVLSRPVNDPNSTENSDSNNHEDIDVNINVNGENVANGQHESVSTSLGGAGHDLMLGDGDTYQDAAAMAGSSTMLTGPSAGPSTMHEPVFARAVKGKQKAAQLPKAKHAPDTMCVC